MAKKLLKGRCISVTGGVIDRKRRQLTFHSFGPKTGLMDLHRLDKYDEGAKRTI